MEQNVQPQPNTPKPPKKKPSLVIRLILFLVALAMILTAVAAVAFRDRLNLDSVKRWFTYRALVLSDSGQAEAFPHGGDVTDTYAVLDRDLLVCSPNNLSLYSGSGARYVDQEVALANPVVDSNGALAVVYDAGGSQLYVLGERELIYSSTEEESILAAHLNRNGQLTVVTQASGYRGRVTVYSSAYEKLMSVNLSSAFVMDAALSDDGKTLAIITIGQQGGSFTSTLSYYAMDVTAGDGSYVPQLTVPLGRNAVLGLRHTQSEVWALGDLGLSIVDHLGEVSSLDWSNKYLKLFDLSGSGFAVALLGTYRAGSQATLYAVDATGTAASLPVNEQILSLSAAGQYFAVLTADRLDIYTSDMTPYRTLEGTQGARRVLLMEDGSAILISADDASYYVPQ